MESGTASQSGGTATHSARILLPVLAGLAATVAGLAFTGANAAQSLIDPGALVRWGFPIVTVLVRLAAILTIGAFSLAAFVIAGPGTRRGEAATPSPAWRATVQIGQISAVAWAALQAVYMVFGTATVSGLGLDAPTFGSTLSFFLLRTDLGITYIAQLALAVLVSALAVGTASMNTACWTAALSAIALVPVALTGHSAGAVGHNFAVSSNWMHTVPLGLWMGGLATLVLVARRLGPELGRAATRYSSIALWCFILVGFSGTLAAVIRLTAPLDLLTSPWGQVLTAKVLLFAAMGWLGWRHREVTIPKLGERPQLFSRLAAVELALMGATAGLAVALSSSSPPLPDDPVVDPSPVFQLSSFPEPDYPSVASWFTQWHIDPLYLAGSVAAVVVYLRWVRRLRQRDVVWPALRTVSWIVAWVMFFWITQGGPYVYGVVLFSAHMVMHMTLVMLFPIFLALAAPITLLLRALPARRDGSRGPREWVLVLIHTRWSRAWAGPIVAPLNFAGSLFVFYYTPLLTLAMTTHVGHVLMVVHFTLAGYLFANLIIGIDPGPNRPDFPIRLVLLFVTMIFHAFFGLSLANMTELLAADYFGRLGLSWWVDALADQQLGGFATWGIGELPTLVLAVIMAVAWSRSDAKDARRLDRRADRDHDAELEAYNRMLAARAGITGPPQD